MFTANSACDKLLLGCAAGGVLINQHNKSDCVMPIGVVRCVRLCLIAEGRDWPQQHDSGGHGQKYGLLSITFVTEVCRSLDASSGKIGQTGLKMNRKMGKKAPEFSHEDGLCHLSLPSRHAPEFGNGTQLKHIQHTANGCRFISLNNTCAKAFHIVTQKMTSYNSYYAWN